MCTINMTLSDAVIEQVRPNFPSQEALVAFAQQQLETILLKVARQNKTKQAKMSKIKTIEELSPEIQELLSMTEPLKGTIPEWDLNGDTARTEALIEKYGC